MNEVPTAKMLFFSKYGTQGKQSCHNNILHQVIE